MFARETSDALTSLVKKIDAEISNNSGLKSFVVVLTDDADKTADSLKAIAKSGGVKNVPLTLVESPAGPASYKIAEDADVTVMLWKGTKVRANHAFKKGGLDEAGIKAILADVPKILD